MIISRTPFRISFFGGGTDYPVWFKEHGGAVLATTIDKYCYISIRRLPLDTAELRSVISFFNIGTAGCRAARVRLLGSAGRRCQRCFRNRKSA